MWPFKSEHRSANYTDAITSAILAGAQQGSVVSRLATAAVESAAGIVGRSFSTAIVDATPAIQAALRPETLAMIGRSLIRRGEILFVIDTGSGDLSLLPASDWDITGRAHAVSWRYTVNVGTPSTTETYSVSGGGVCHIRYAVNPQSPWLGIGPLQSASLSGSLSSELEAALLDEIKGPRGQIIAVPDGRDTDSEGNSPTYDKLETVLSKLNGKLALLDGGDGDQGGPNTTWKPQRLGFNPPTSSVELHRAISEEVLGACGIPLGLISATAAGSARESYRQFLHSTLAPLGKIVSSEMSAKLETPITLDWSELRAGDIATRARAYKGLTDERMSGSEARRIAGLE